MDYRDFVEIAKEELPERLPESLWGAVIDDAKVDKLQGQSYEGIRVIPKDSIVSMSVDLQPYFEMAIQGMPMGEVLNGIADRIDSVFAEQPDFSLDMLDDYEKMKERLTVQLVGREANEEMLQQIPHQDMEDLCLVYRVNVQKSGDFIASFLLTNEALRRLGIIEEQLHQDALVQTLKQEPFEIKTMAEMIKEMAGEEVEVGDDLPLYVATNQSRMNGAAVLMYPDFMEKAAEVVNDSFYVLPSSIHEIILVPENSGPDMEELQMMVQEVNATQVSPQEQLSDYVYHYDTQECVFERADNFLKRMQEKEQSKEVRKDSVLADLLEHQKECAEKPRKDTGMYRVKEATL